MSILARPVRPKLAAAALLTFLGGSACATLDIGADWDPDIRFADLHTWAWAPARAEYDRGDPRLRSDLVHDRLQSAIADTLDARGYERHPENPDFYVAYHVAIDDELEAHTLYRNYAIGPHYGAWLVPETYLIERYEIGTLLIDIIDRRTNRLVWRGRAQSELEHLDGAAAREVRTREVVRKLLERFPPR